MNLQLSSLRLSTLLSSPILSLSQNSAKSHLVTFDSQIFRSAFHFINFEGLSHSHKHLKGSFKQFLTTPMLYSGIEFTNFTIYTVGFNFQLESELTVKDCTFISCSSLQTGGAICYGHQIGQYSVFNLDRCYFINCWATHGGALFATSNRSVLIRNCYSRCHATISSHAIYMRSIDSKATDVGYISINNCPDTDSSADCAVHLSRATFNFKYNNATSNNRGGRGMGVYVMRAIALYTRYCEFSNLTGSSIIHLRRAKDLYSTFLKISNNRLSESLFTVSENPGQVNLYLNRATIVNNVRTNALVYEVEGSLEISLHTCYIDASSRQLIDDSCNLTYNSPRDIESILDELPPIPAPTNCLIPVTIHTGETNESTKYLILVISGCALLIISVGVVFLYRYNKNKKEEYENWISNRSYASGSAI